MRRLIATCSLLALILVGTPVAASAGGGATTGFRFFDLVAGDGVALKANTIAPATPGRHPGIVFVSSWGVNDLQYVVQARSLAEAGYVVLSYTTRGFWGSGGVIEVAGPEDTADARTAVDWMVANPAVDPAHIGIAGMSYGAGISLIAAGHDPRIRAVVAMSTWTDLNYSLYGQQTRHLQAPAALTAVAALTGHPGPEFVAALRDFYANRNIPQVQAWGRVRSAATYLDGINANRPAIMMANGYGDSIFPPNQLVDFYGRLAGPKRLELAPGDHAIVEGLGLAGLPNHVWTDLHRWFDHYLRGLPTGIDTEPPVVLRPHGSDAVEQYADWAAATGTTSRLAMTGRHWWNLTGDLAAAAPATDWSWPTWSGIDTTAAGGVVLVSNGFDALTGIPPTTWLPTVSRVNAGVWTSARYPGGAPVRGIPHAHLTLTPNASHGTAVVYLYDLDDAGLARLITHAPFTWLSGTAGVPVTLDVPLFAVAYDVPAGHRLAAVVDGKDPLYLDVNDGVAPTFTYTGASWIDVPLR